MHDNDFFKITDQICSQLELSDWNWIKLEQPLSLSFYEAWIDQSYHGEMTYLKDHLPLKKDPQKILPQAQSALVVSQTYFPHPLPQNLFPGSQIALYAQGQDYHFWFKNKLKSICEELSKIYPNETFLSFTDSAPVLERDLAYRAGLGWIGKNTCLINQKKGSFFFIGEIYSSLNHFQTPTAVHDFCGTCSKCIDICPTQAIEEPRLLNATKCISYWTIEAKYNPPDHLRTQFGNWLFGCDLCQTVCPWNQKAIKFHQNTLANPKETYANSSIEQDQLIEDLKFILSASGKQIQKKTVGSPLQRTGPNGLKRNAMIIIANNQLTQLKDYVTRYVEHPKLNDIAVWTLERLKSESEKTMQKP